MSRENVEVVRRLTLATREDDPVKAWAVAAELLHPEIEMDTTRLPVPGLAAVYRFLVGDSAFYFTVDDGSIRLHDGWSQDPAVVLTTDEETWADIASGKVRFLSATATGALSVAGKPQAVKRLRKIFSRNQMLAQAEATINRDRGLGGST